MDANRTTIHLVRHGHILNPEEVFHGRLPGFPLSDVGQQQAAAAARLLKERPVTAIYSSPMLRTQQTARILQQALQPTPPLEIEPLLHEIYSPFDGYPHAEMEARDWDFYTEADPPYEQPDDIVQRVRRFFEWVRQEHRGQEVIGVTHADPLAFIWMWVLKKPIKPENRKLLDTYGLSDDYPATASVSTFSFATADPDEQPRAKYVRPY